MRFKSFWAVRFAALMIVGIVFVGMAISEVLFFMKDSVDLNYLAAEDVEPGMHVHMYVYDVMDCYSTESTVTTRLGVKVNEEGDTARTYLIPISEYDTLGNWVDEYYISVKVNPKDYSVYDQILEETWQRWYQGAEYNDQSALIELEGKIKPLSSEKTGFLIAYFADPDIDAYVKNGDFYPENTLYYEIEPKDPVSIWLYLISGLVLLAIGALGVFIPMLRGGRVRKAKPVTSISYVDGANVNYNGTDRYSQNGGYNTTNYGNSDGYGAGATNYGNSDGYGTGATNYGNSDGYGAGATNYGNSDGYGTGATNYGNSDGYGTGATNYGNSDSYGAGATNYGNGGNYGNSDNFGFGSSSYGNSNSYGSKQGSEFEDSSYSTSSVEETLYINGVPYAKSKLQKVNDLIKSGNSQEAKNMLMELNHMDDFEADQIVFNWNGYYK